MSESHDVVVVGAGAAGLMAGIHAARSGAGSVLLVDGARTIGAKILVAGGGRCNVTHHAVDETAYAGSTRPAIRKVLRRFDVPETVTFFRDLGVFLKREDTGKLFPTTDSARTVLDALRSGLTRAGAELRHPWRVSAIDVRPGGGFAIAGPDDAVIHADRVILATGGRSLPKTGSDGWGHDAVRALGHTITPRVFPALVPLTIDRAHPLCALTGIAVPARLTLCAGSGKRLVSFTNSTLCTHFGLSGPSVLDISRYVLDARFDDPAATLRVNWLPDDDPEDVDAELRALGKQSVGRFLARRMPERMAEGLCAIAGVDSKAPGHALTRAARLALHAAVTDLVVPVEGNRGYKFAEVTAGGVPLREIELKTMESRVCPGLHLCGEICDVDGRIGGFNFQWAWASGWVAGWACGR